MYVCVFFWYADDQADYFSDISSTWATESERATARKAVEAEVLQREEAARNHNFTVTIDLAGRQIVSEGIVT